MKVYLFIYVGVSISLFLRLWARDSGSIKNIHNLKRSNFMQLRVMMMLLSLGGLPPLLGFISKWVVITVGVSGPWLFVLFVLILGSLIRLFYYLRLFFSIFLSCLKKHRFIVLNTGRGPVVVVNVLNVVGGLGILISGLLGSM